MDTMISKNDWNALDIRGRREAVGVDPVAGNYMTCFREFLGDNMVDIALRTLGNTSYLLYCEWYVLTQTPLGKALA